MSVENHTSQHELHEQVDRMMRERPTFHRGAGGEELNWNALPETLHAIASNVARGSATFETGCGASTVVFAAAGGRHTTVSADGYEHDRVRSYCDDVGVDHSSVTFIEGTSDSVLPSLEMEPLQFVFIDGGHAFPYAVIDFHYTATALGLGGMMLLDDVPIPAVRTVYDLLISDPSWESAGTFDNRASMHRKVGAYPEPMAPWREQGFNRRYPDYSFLASRSDRIRERAAHELLVLRRRASQNETAKRLYRSLKRR